MEDEKRWQAVRTRDPSHDGDFVYAVRSTGIYCRPSCPSRRPKRDNVEFHDSPAQAQDAGYRPCKRCRPDQPGSSDPTTRAVLAACRAMEASDSLPSLEELAQAAGLSPSHFHRAFKAHLGLTPRAYAQAQRAQRVREHLAGNGSVTDALYAAGFNAASRFYDQAEAMLGMSPRTYRDGGAQTRIHYALGHSWLGFVLAARTMRGVCAILLGDSPAPLVDDLAERFPRAELIAETKDHQHVLAAVIAAVEDPKRGLDLPLDIRGTAFQERVWQALRQIPPGTTLSYAQVAQSLGQPRASRAVAGACAANPLAVAVPCHRVVRGDGGLSGYRWGIERKRDLLMREGVSLRRDSDPNDD